MLWPKAKTKLPTERETFILSEETKFICSFPTNSPEPFTSISVFLAGRQSTKATKHTKYNVLPNFSPRVEMPP